MRRTLCHYGAKVGSILAEGSTQHGLRPHTRTTGEHSWRRLMARSFASDSDAGAAAFDPFVRPSQRDQRPAARERDDRFDRRRPPPPDARREGGQWRRILPSGEDAPARQRSEEGARGAWRGASDQRGRRDPSDRRPLQHGGGDWKQQQPPQRRTWDGRPGSRSQPRDRPQGSAQSQDRLPYRRDGQQQQQRWPPSARQQQDNHNPRSFDTEIDDLDMEERRDSRRKGKDRKAKERDPGANKQERRRPAAPLSSRHSAKLFYRKNEGPGQGRQQQRGSKAQPKHQEAPERPSGPRQVTIPEQVSVRDLAALLEMEPERLEEVLIDIGDAPKSLEDLVAFDSAELACLEANVIAVSSGGHEDGDDDDAQPRPAVIAVMGHVDHGKTSLLDALRSTSMAAGEAGGITQHVGAFEVSMPESGTSITFLDTPGHAAFSAMRARGAAVTDIVVLVVAADDSVMPQTQEAISHANAAKCPIVVALSKVDVPLADPERVKRDLASLNVELEEYGGDVQVVHVAAPKGIGLRELEEALLLQAEMLNIKASQTAALSGAVIEAKLDKGQGPVATVIVKRGTLRVGDCVVIGCQWGRVKSLRSPSGEMVQEVLPGRPALVAGLRGVPEAGDEVMSVSSEERARRVSAARLDRQHDYRLARLSRTAAAARIQAEAEARARLLVEQKAARRARRRRRHSGGSGAAPGTEQKLSEGDGDEDDEDDEAVVMPVLIKADVFGSIEAVQSAVEALSSSVVSVQIVHTGVGPVSVSDVSLATVTGAKIIAFNVKPDSNAVAKEAKAAGVAVLQYRVIYHLLEELGKMLADSAPRVQVETTTGQAQVLQIFEVTGKNRTGEPETVIAGCKVTQGTLHWQQSKAYRVIRGGEVVHEGLIKSLKREKSEAQEVKEGTECGLVLEGYKDYVVGDMLQCICIEERAPKTENVTGGGVRVVEGEHHGQLHH